MAVNNEFHLGKNTVIILVVIQLTAMLFGMMMISNNLNSIGCTSTGLPGQSGNPSGTSALCTLQNQAQGIQGTVTNLLSTFSCAFNPTSQSCSVGWVSGDLTPEIFIQFVNVVLGAFEFVAYGLVLIGLVLALMIYVLTIFFPQLFASGAIGSGLGNLGAGLGIIAGILVAGTVLIELFLLLQFVVDRLPWFGKH